MAERAYRYRLYPTRQQIEALEGQLGFACDLYNAALEQRKWAYRTWGISVGRKDQQHELTELRQELDLPMNYVAQEMVLQRLQLAFDAFFRRLRNGETPGFPRFRSRHRFNTLSWRAGRAGGAKVVDGRLRIQGVGHIKVKWHRDLPSKPKQTRITRRAGKWYVAFSVAVEAEPLKRTGRKIGVDMGVARLASLSNGNHLLGPRARTQGAARVRRASRSVARKHHGSHRRRKAARRLARLRDHERSQRRDRAHKIARGLVDRFDLIAIEDLQTRNMVRGYRSLNREINDQGWAMLAQCLAYKAESAGRELVRVDPRNTSRTCAECGAVDPASRKGRHFTCTSCGHEADSDTNAACNILARATARTERSGANAQTTSVAREAPSVSSQSSEERGCPRSPGGVVTHPAIDARVPEEPRS